MEVFGQEKGEAAVIKELKQLHNMRGVESTSSLTRKQKRVSLVYLMYLTESKGGSIKGRDYTDGRNQRETTAKEEMLSPTMAIKSVILACVIDTEEGRIVAVNGIPGVYLNTDMDKLVHIRLNGHMSDLLVKVKHVEMGNGKKLLYIVLRQVFYDCLKAAFYFGITFC